MEIKEKWGNAVKNCRLVRFKTPYKSKPRVFGSVDRRQFVPDGDESISHTIEQVTTDSFVFCMRGEFTTAEQYEFLVFFNWMAVDATAKSSSSNLATYIDLRSGSLKV